MGHWLQLDSRVFVTRRQVGSALLVGGIDQQPADVSCMYRSTSTPLAVIARYDRAEHHEEREFGNRPLGQLCQKSPCSGARLGKK